MLTTYSPNAPRTRDPAEVQAHDDPRARRWPRWPGLSGGLHRALGPLKYYGPHVVFMPLALLAFELRGIWVFAIPVLIFVLSPLAELALAPDLRHVERRELDPLRSGRLPFAYSLAPRLALPVLLMLVASYLTHVLEAERWWETLGMVLTMGTFCGALGINAAHELLHRRSKLDRTLSRALLCTTLYVHFYTEHIRGHHALVGTSTDPVTARRGESLYHFWLRSSWQGFRSALRIDAAEVARSEAMQALLWLALALAWGVEALLWYVPAALAGVLLLETINYIEHYGLRRERRPDGRLAPVEARHSWTSNHVLSRWFMFELPRHADHHAHPGRPYPLLQATPGGPQLPTGYPGMMALALVPAAWFAVMDRRLPGERPTEYTS